MQFSLQELDAVATGEPEGRSLVDALNAAAARLAEIGDKTASEGPRSYVGFWVTRPIRRRGLPAPLLRLSEYPL